MGRKRYANDWKRIPSGMKKKFGEREVMVWMSGETCMCSISKAKGFSMASLGMIGLQDGMEKLDRELGSG